MTDDSTNVAIPIGELIKSGEVLDDVGDAGDNTGIGLVGLRGGFDGDNTGIGLVGLRGGFDGDNTGIGPDGLLDGGLVGNCDLFTVRGCPEMDLLAHT